jgi:hypothetical protein
MHINSFFMRDTAPSDLPHLFKSLPSVEAKPTVATAKEQLGQSEGAGKKSIYDAVKIVFDLLANRNPSGVSAVRMQEGYVVSDIIKGSEQGDVVAYANASRVATAYIETGGGDDTINFSSGVRSSHEIRSGEGNDTVAVTAPWTGTVDGGGGNDAIGVSGEYLGIVDGGSGDDVIAVAGGVITGVNGGEGNDKISVSAAWVSSVSGGDGDDVISVSSENRRVFEKGGDYDILVMGTYRAPNVSGGQGNDKISFDGEGFVSFRLGDGQDEITISDRTEFDLFGKAWNDKLMNVADATFSNENGTVVVTFAGTDDKLTIRSASGEELRIEQIYDDRFAVMPVSSQTPPSSEVRSRTSWNAG